MRPYLSIAISFALALGACSFSDTNQTVHVTPVFIEDLNGQPYDVTFAVIHFGFDVKKFSSSAGPGARPAIINPEMLLPGQSGYPTENATSQILGASDGTEARAYAIADFARNEVIDDRIGEAFVTVAY